MFRKEKVLDKPIGEIKIELQQMVMTQIEGQLKDKFTVLQEMVAKEIISQLEWQVRDILAERIDSAYDEVLSSGFKEKFEKEYTSQKHEINKKVDHYFDVLKSYRSFLMADQFKAQLRLMDMNIKVALKNSREALVKADKMAYNLPDELLPKYTNDQIKKAFLESGAKLSDLTKRFNVTTQMASKYINGDIKGADKRHLIYQYLTTFNDVRDEIMVD